MRLRNILIAVAALVVATVIGGRCYENSRSEWEARVDSVQRLVEEGRGRRQVLQEQVEDLKVKAAGDSVRADSLVRELEQDSVEIQERIVRVESATPDSLRDHPAILARDSLITDLREDVAGWKHAFRVEERRANRLSRALMITERSLASAEADVDSLMVVLDDRPGERPWFLPRIGIGPFAGWCAEGRPCAGPAAVTISWEISP